MGRAVCLACGVPCWCSETCPAARAGALMRLSAENPRGRRLGYLAGCWRCMPHCNGNQAGQACWRRREGRGFPRLGEPPGKEVIAARLARPKVGISSPITWRGGHRAPQPRPRACRSRASRAGPGRCRIHSSPARRTTRGLRREATSGPPQFLRVAVTGVIPAKCGGRCTVWAAPGLQRSDRSVARSLRREHARSPAQIAD